LLRNRFEIFAHFLETFLCFYIADDGQYSIVRRIVGPEKIRYVIDGAGQSINDPMTECCSRNWEGQIINLGRSSIGLISTPACASKPCRSDYPGLSC
jgi:hypothetical protein